VLTKAFHNFDNVADVPVTWSLDEGADFARVLYIEPYTFDEWRDTIEELRRNPLFAFRRRIGGLIDRTHAGPPPADFDNSVAAYIGRHPLLLKGRRLAFVAVDTDSLADAWQHARMYEEAGAISTVFGAETDAAAWLREAADEE
jgi:hypothetical protein